MAVTTIAAAEPVWLKNARQLLGLKEIVGSRHEPKVLEFFAEAGHPEIHNDETAWCAAFANAMLRRAGYAGTGSLAARSFLTWGEKLAKPRPGCVAVFKRGNSSWEGHVAFFIREVGDRVEILGGNQSNSVSITTMPKSALLGYRWPLIVGASTPKPAPPAPPAPVKKPAASAGAKAATGAATVAVGGAGAAAAKAGLSAPEILAIITVASLVVGGAILIGYRIIKGNWPWTSTGNQSPALSPLSAQSSELSLAQASVALSAASSAASPETLLRQLSAPRKPRKRSARQSQKTRTRPRKSSASKAKKASKSSLKRKSKSKS
jgi:uncharacterized protein (TIGR02594 family)